MILDKSYGAPRITENGVAVAKEIELSDKFENMGMQWCARWRLAPSAPKGCDAGSNNCNDGLVGIPFRYQRMARTRSPHGAILLSIIATDDLPQ